MDEVPAIQHPSLWVQLCAHILHNSDRGRPRYRWSAGRGFVLHHLPIYRRHRAIRAARRVLEPLATRVRAKELRGETGRGCEHHRLMRAGHHLLALRGAELYYCTPRINLLLLSRRGYMECCFCNSSAVESTREALSAVMLNPLLMLALMVRGSGVASALSRTPYNVYCRLYRREHFCLRYAAKVRCTGTEYCIQ